MKKLITAYTFDASAQTVTLTGLTSTLLEQVLLITNVTDNIIIYNFADATKGGSIASGVITLAYDTTSMADTDDLQIFIDDLVAEQTDALTDTQLRASAVPVSVTGVATSAKQDTIISHLDGVEGLLATIDGDTGSIDAKTPALGQALAAASVPVVLPAAQITTLTPPAAITGFATSAKQDTIIGHLDGVETILGAIETATEAIQAGQLPDSHNVTVDNASLAVTHTALTELAAAINSDKVDVNIVSGSAAGTEYTEDAAAAANPAGGALILVREDGRAGGLTTTDGDNVAARGNNKGELYVKTTDSDALLTTIDGDTGNISTKIDTLAGAVSGTEMQVDVLTMPTTTVQATDLDIRPLVNTDVVTAELSATDNAVLDAIAASTAAIETAVEGTLTVTGGGGGVEYTEGDTDATIVGSAIMWEDTGDTLRAVSASKPLPISDAGGTLTVDGTVAVTNAGITTIAGAVSGTEMQVDVLTSALPTGASTLAEQQSQTTHLATIAGDTTDIETAVELLDDTVYTDGTGTVTKGIAVLGQDGTNPQAIKTDADGELQVDVLTMPTVTVDSELPTAAALSDATANPTTPIVGAASMGWDGSQWNRTFQYGPGDTDNNDRGLMVQAENKVYGAAGTSTWSRARGVSNATDSTGVGIPSAGILAQFDDTSPGTVTENRFGNVRMSVRREVYTQIRDAAGNERGLNIGASGDASVTVVSALPAGTNAIGKLAANSGVDIGDVDVTSISAGSNLIGDVSLQPRTGNGCTIFRSLDLDESEEEVKATAGNVYGYCFHNKAATTMWLKLYNATAANTTVGTTTPVFTFGLPAGASGNVGFPYPVGFATAISAAVTTGIADNDTGAPAANDVSINIFYK